MIHLNRDEIAHLLADADAFENDGVTMEFRAYQRAADKIVLLVREREIEAMEQAGC